MESLGLDGRMTVKWMSRRLDGVCTDWIIMCVGKIQGRGIENRVTGIRIT